MNYWVILASFPHAFRTHIAICLLEYSHYVCRTESSAILTTFN
ncbi:hypothetical protein yrohd0001_17080 [Yersinia rohdei ATCC 43380]|nr:hypothetical protein yrohd0001_17080 [Yersinia rohdei ATCC 43380]